MGHLYRAGPTCQRGIRTHWFTESVLRVIDLFGVERCFVASNFPVDLKSGWPAARLFGAFARLVGAMPEADRQRLFAENARRAYGVADSEE